MPSSSEREPEMRRRLPAWHVQLVIGSSRSRIGSCAISGLAEDAVQQTLVLAWRELPSLRDVERFDAWLRRLLVNACYREARRGRNWTTNVRLLPGNEPDRTDTERNAPSRVYVLDTTDGILLVPTLLASTQPAP